MNEELIYMKLFLWMLVSPLNSRGLEFSEKSRPCLEKATECFCLERVCAEKGQGLQVWG